MSKGLETQLVSECAPTLAGIKTANLFNYKYSSRTEFIQELAEANKQLNIKGLYIEALKCGDASALIYVYRRKKESIHETTQLSFKLWKGFDRGIH